MKYLTLALLFVCLSCVGGKASAALFTGSSGNRAASVEFQIDGNGRLLVTLTNTSTVDVVDPVGILTAVFFNGSGTLTPYSADVVAPNTILFDSPNAPIPANVGGEWGYETGFTPVSGLTRGISSSGLGVFSVGNFPNFANLQGPPGSPGALDGLQYGITSAGDDPQTGNQKVTGSQSLIKNSVQFTLDFAGITGQNLLNSITKVRFQYGTALSEGNIVVTEDDGGGTSLSLVPEPSSLVVWGLLAFLGFVFGCRRRLK